MKKRSIVFFAAMLIALLCITIGAMAECDPGDHNFSTYTTKEPTCNETGLAVQKCTKCGYISAGSERIVEKKPHDYRWYPSVAATCTSKGQEYSVCYACGVHGETREVDALGHNWSDWGTLVAPTCEGSGTEQRTCKRGCGAHEERTVGPLGHLYGDWVVTTAPTCEDPGVETQVCARNSAHKNTRSVGALGHNYGAWAVTTPATCENPGVETQVCSRNSSHTNTRAIAALGHQWGPEVTTPATCVAEGAVKQTCQRDSSHVRTVRTIPIDENNHDWGNWQQTKKPTCTTPGEETRVCKRSSSHYQVRQTGTDPDAHVWDKGTVIKEPTLTEEGQKKYVCTLNETHTKIVNLGLKTMVNNAVCAFGPRLRDTNLYPYNTDAWYMFTPFDASKDGKQTYELVASNSLIVGSLTLTIKEGTLKVDYDLYDQSRFKITLEFFTVLNRIGDLTQYEPEQLLGMRMSKGEVINLQEKFGDDTNLVLYFCSRCNYTYSQKFSFLNYESASHQRILSQMRDLMD